jgi:hypothetical protein
MKLPITFLNSDSDIIREALARSLQTIPEGIPILGLVLKVAQTPEGEEKLVNYEFADSDLIRSLALVLPVASEPTTPKE